MKLSVVIDTFVSGFWKNFDTMTIDFFFVFTSPLLYHTITSRRQTTSWCTCFKSIYLPQKVFILLNFIESIEYSITWRSWLICSHIWCFWRFFLLLKLVFFPPVLRLIFNTWLNGLCFSSFLNNINSTLGLYMPTPGRLFD